MNDTKVSAGKVIGRCKVLTSFDEDGNIHPLFYGKEYEIVRVVGHTIGERQFITNALVTDYDGDPGYLLTLHEKMLSWIVLGIDEETERKED
jgi:hypothetical protein